jgi:type VI secretion system secreted protein VgrG
LPNRLLQLTTPLGDDVLIPIGLDGAEGLSELFAFTVEGERRDDAVDVARIVVRPPDLERRALAEQLVGGDALRRYRMVLRPKLWLLTRTADCRIFQNQTVPQIADTLAAANDATMPLM